MIKDLRTSLETSLQLPVHYVAITESDQRPCATVRVNLLDSRHELKRASGWRLTGVELDLFADDYEQLDELAEQVLDAYDGFHGPLVDGAGRVKLYVDDEDDQAYPSPDGSDDWVYSRTIQFRVHYQKTKG